MQKSLNNLLIIKGYPCDPGAIQTHDLQNRNLTLYSLSYGAILFMRGQKYKKSSHLPNDSSFFIVLRYPHLLTLYYFEMLYSTYFINLTFF